MVLCLVKWMNASILLVISTWIWDISFVKSVSRNWKKTMNDNIVAAIGVEGQEVLVVFFDKEAYNRSKHVLDVARVTEVGDRVYAAFHDPIERYEETRLNQILKDYYKKA